MHPRQGLRQVAVAFIGDDDAAAGFGDQEVGPGDADIRRQEFRAQRGAGFRLDITALMENAVGGQVGVSFAERLLPVLHVEVEGGGDDVARQFVTKLDDVFTEIGFEPA